MPEADWMREGRCHGHRDPDTWFRTSAVEDAKDMCLACPVKVECLEFAIDQGIRYGVWGGLDPRERVRLRRAAA